MQSKTYLFFSLFSFIFYLETTILREKRRENNEKIKEQKDYIIHALEHCEVLTGGRSSGKTLELIKGIMPELLKMDIQFVVLGLGDPYYENMFKWRI